MKKIRDCISKWNEMYELVMADEPNAEKDVWMNRIKEIVNQPAQAGEYAFYVYDGEVGVLFFLDRSVINERGYESFNKVAFIPGYDMSEVLSKELDQQPRLTLDDCYTVYAGCVEIDIHHVVNPENNQRLVWDWTSDVYADTDEYVRELCLLTDSYCDWTSLRSDMVDNIVDAINKDEDLSGLKEEWENTVAEYRDPLDYCTERVDFASVVDNALCRLDCLAYGEYKRHDYDEYVVDN